MNQILILRLNDLHLQHSAHAVASPRADELHGAARAISALGAWPSCILLAAQSG
jgi:hypothetical protein